MSAPEDNAQIAQQYPQWMIDSEEPESFVQKSYKVIITYSLGRGKSATDFRTMCLSFELELRTKRFSISFEKDKRFGIPLFEMLVGEHDDEEIAGRQSSNSPGKDNDEADEDSTKCDATKTENSNAWRRGKSQRETSSCLQV